MHTNLEKTLIIANPVAHSGKGKAGAEFCDRFLKSYEAATTGYEIRYTKAPKDATAIAARAEGFDSVIALGGDGVIHEVVNGLMSIHKDKRPTLGIIPLGSGNDFARTCNMSINDTKHAITQLMNAKVKDFEVGKVNDTYFIQTLSFGLDAAIAIDTTKRRAQDTRQEGEALFVTSGLKIFSQNRKGWVCHASFDGGQKFDILDIILTFQIGPTYGGGFQVTPTADPTDGLLEVCYTMKRPPLPRILALFGLAKYGKHTFSKALTFTQVRTAHLDFDQQVPVQTDGEELLGTHFDIQCIPDALKVYVGEPLI